MKNILIDQPAGIGDILFLQKMVKCLSSSEVKVFHPVLDSISWMTDYLDTVCKKSDCKDIDFDYTLKTDGCSNGTPFKIMEAKYKMVGLEFDDYINYVDIKRDIAKEEALFKSVVGDTKKYRLVNPMYGTPENGSTFRMRPEKSSYIPNIEMSIVPGYTLFDWCKIICEASEIHTTDTAIMFLIEKYPCLTNDLVCYSRRPYTSEIDYLFKKPWKYII